MILISILQIIIKIILVLLLVLVCLSLLLLFAPIGYKINGKVHESEYDYEFGIRWLLGLVNFNIRYNNEDFCTNYRFFWKNSKDDSEEDSDEDSVEKDNEAAESLLDDEEVKENSNHSEDDNAKESGKANKSDDLEDRQVTDNEDKSGSDENCKKKSSDEGKNNKTKHKKKNKVKREKRKLKWPEKINTIKNDESCIRALKKLKVDFVRFMKIISPKKIAMDIKYSLEESQLTGMSLGILSLLPFLYKKTVHIYPDFQSDKMYLEGEFYLKGMTYPIKLIGILCRVVIDNDYRKLYNELKK